MSRFRAQVVCFEFRCQVIGISLRIYIAQSRYYSSTSRAHNIRSRAPMYGFRVEGFGLGCRGYSFKLENIRPKPLNSKALDPKP